MFIVKRVSDSLRGLSVNSVGYAGSILVKGDQELLTLKEIGPMTLIEQLADSQKSNL